MAHSIRLAMRALWILPLLLLAGCSGPDSEPLEAKPDVRWPDFQIFTTPVEAFELTGTNIVHFGPEATFFFVEREDAMHRYAVIQGDALYVSNFLQGFTKWSLENYPSSRAYRFQAWDPKTIWDQAEGGRSVEGGFRVNETVSFPHGEGFMEITVLHQGTRISEVRVVTDADIESPYRFVAPSPAMPEGFEMKVPTRVLLPEQVETMDPVARDAHVSIIQWIDAYVAQTGQVPDSVDASTLRLQMGIGGDWPTNVYQDRDVEASEASGDFAWYRCNDRDATYLGYAWDGSPVGTSYGAGCTLASNA